MLKKNSFPPWGIKPPIADNKQGQKYGKQVAKNELKAGSESKKTKKRPKEIRNSIEIMLYQEKKLIPFGTLFMQCGHLLALTLRNVDFYVENSENVLFYYWNKNTILSYNYKHDNKQLFCIDHILL